MSCESTLDECIQPENSEPPRFIQERFFPKTRQVYWAQTRLQEHWRNTRGVAVERKYDLSTPRSALVRSRGSLPGSSSISGKHPRCEQFACNQVGLPIYPLSRQRIRIRWLRVRHLGCQDGYFSEPSLVVLLVPGNLVGFDAVTLPLIHLRGVHQPNVATTEFPIQRHQGHQDQP